MDRSFTQISRACSIGFLGGWCVTWLPIQKAHCDIYRLLLDQVGISNNFDQRWTPAGERFIENRFQFFSFGDPKTLAAAQVRVRGETRIVQLSLPNRPLTRSLLFGYLSKL